jgi:ATP-dependent Clp protease ATP-binding subunit ClpC
VFERYTESARRALFFARYEASQLGSLCIDTEHMLLGLMRKSKGVAAAILMGADCSLETLRKEIEARSVFRENVATSIEIPFSTETKLVLRAQLHRVGAPPPGAASREGDRRRTGACGSRCSSR